MKLKKLKKDFREADDDSFEKFAGHLYGWWLHIIRWIGSIKLSVMLRNEGPALGISILPLLFFLFLFRFFFLMLGLYIDRYFFVNLILKKVFFVPILYNLYFSCFYDVLNYYYLWGAYIILINKKKRTYIIIRLFY